MVDHQWNFVKHSEAHTSYHHTHTHRHYYYYDYYYYYYYYYYYLLTSTYLLTTTYYHLPLPGKIVDSSSTRTAIGWQPKYKTFGAFIDTLV